MTQPRGGPDPGREPAGNIPNPKRSDAIRKSELFGYYAGFSPTFVDECLSLFAAPKGATVLDPWNGAGTTTRVAANRGYHVRGFDINPVMVIVAKVPLLSGLKPSAVALADDIVLHSRRHLTIPLDDPLSEWFASPAATALRGLELALRRVFLPRDSQGPVILQPDLTAVSPLAAFYYTALFRTVRDLTARYRSSNPTWISRGSARRVQVTSASTIRRFLHHVQQMEAVLATRSNADPLSAVIDVGDSANIPLRANSVDAVVTSPPYCTRLDYAVATSPELALLGASVTDIRGLRNRLMGSTIVQSNTPHPSEEWGPSCNAFLDAVARHPSKASVGYYSKVFRSYFGALFESLADIRRVLRVSGHVALVVQDSRYKDLHNDLPAIVSEMAAQVGLPSYRRADFMNRSSYRTINSRSRIYGSTIAAIESVLFLKPRPN